MSLTGTMEISRLQGKDICAILKVCADTGVSEFTFGELSIKFGKIQGSEGVQPTFEGTHSLPPQPGKVEKPEEPVEMEMDPIQQLALDDLEKAQLLIDNPSAFEASIMQDHLRGDYGDEGTKARRVESAI